MKFTKMQGIGNDFVVVNNIEEKLHNPAEIAIKLCDRNFGIGGDGLLLIDRSEVADYKMRLFNADGSEAEMCGNGIRCIGKYICERLMQKHNISVETLGGIKKLEMVMNNQIVEKVKVDMGEPILIPAKVPVIADSSMVVNEKFNIDGNVYYITAVSMGNPHAVIFVKNVSDLEIAEIGKKIEKSSFFPNKTNVEFVQIIDENRVKVRVWERGVGETLACGTGACASAVASFLNKKTKKTVEVALPGGKLNIEWAADNHIFMTGNADIVFEGETL